MLLGLHEWLLGGYRGLMLKKILLLCSLFLTGYISAATVDGPVVNNVQQDRAARINCYAAVPSVGSMTTGQFFDLIEISDNQLLAQQVNDARARGLTDDAIVALLISDFDMLILIENELLKLSIEAAALQKEASWKKKKKILTYLFGFASAGLISWIAYKKYQDYRDYYKSNRDSDDILNAIPVNPIPPAPAIYGANCLVCFRDLDPRGENSVALVTCGHAVFDKHCMKDAISDGLQRRTMERMCCANGACNKHFQIEDLKKLGEGEDRINQFGRILIDDQLARLNVAARRHCPTRDCNITIVNQAKCRDLKEIERLVTIARVLKSFPKLKERVMFVNDNNAQFPVYCIGCHAKYCGACLKDHAQDKRCGLVVDQKIEEYLKESMIRKRCKKCQTIVALDEGCKYVRCQCTVDFNKEICIACGFHTERHHEFHDCRTFNDNDPFLSQEELDLDKEFQAAWNNDTWKKADFDIKREAARAVWLRRRQAR